MTKKPKSSKTAASTAIASACTHPGPHIRDSVLTPKNLSVVAAAKLVGVGRPALSNFLNGHVAATPEMASRLQVAFGVSAQSLLDMQAAYDAAQAKAKGAPANAVPYVVPFLGIKANDIENWAVRSIPARARLAVLLRTLVTSSASDITKIDFPGNDDAERPGWDGYVEAAHATPWIPEGPSGWEFGTTQEVKGKAEADFTKSLRNTPKSERDQMTFVFVTPRHWPGKTDWVKTKKSKGRWKDVRAYDSSDLEQWLEQSLAAQAWFANETFRHSNGVRSLDRCWADWAHVGSPPLAGSLFAPAINDAKRTILSRLSKAADEPTVIAADSVEEALAFLAQLFGPHGGDGLEKLRGRVLVFDEPGVLPRLAQGAKDFIAVATNRKVERELGPLSRTMHTIVVCPRNAANSNPHVVLEPLNEEAFGKSLQAMGYGRDDVAKYSNESGRSLTVLRRRLSNVPAVRTPEWAADPEIAAKLAPFLFIGAWSSTNIADQSALMRLGDAPSYDELEKTCRRLAALNDSPLWSVGTYRGVVSKIDLLFAVAGYIGAEDLRRYFVVAKMVLGEDDPKLDLPDGDRWTAAIHGKSRQFSAALREGVSETLVLLAIHGNHLFRSRLGFDCELAVTRLIDEILTPLKTRTLEANDRDLPAYAEAAPERFLSILEEDLRTDHPESYGLMRPAGSGIFGGGCPRTGLLWALEGLAWNADTLLRAALVLAQLAEIEIHDNWTNKPINSLESIFRVWMPQTAADQDARLRALRHLADRFPSVAWKISIAQLDSGPRTGHYNHKPTWRNDAQGFGEPFETWDPIFSFTREVFEIVLSWKGGHTREMLCDLIRHLHDLPEQEQARVWDLVKSWALAGATDGDKALVREKIRVTVMSRRGLRRSKKKDSSELSVAAKASYLALEPSDLLHKYEWLFRESWVEESADEIHDELDFEERDKRMTRLRIEALVEVVAARGFLGVFELAEMGNAAHQMGWLLTQHVLRVEELPAFLISALRATTHGQSWSKKNLVIGALGGVLDESNRVGLLTTIKEQLSGTDFVQLLLLAPFRRSTWQLVDGLAEPLRKTYWREVAPDWIRNSDDENNEAVERLLAVHRPRAAFACVHFKLETIGPELLFRLMSEMVQADKEEPGKYQLDQYYVERAFVLMDESALLTLEQKAGLEFAYIDALSKPWSKGDGYGIPNLEKYVEAHPEFFVQAVVWAYKRADESEDPTQWKVAPEHVQRLAERGNKLLDGLHQIPGHDDLGELTTDKVAAWVKTVRDACANLGRLDIADICIGKLLSNASVGEDGIWPCEPVRQVMEELHSKMIMKGGHTGLYNSRGVTWRGEGGSQERDLAEKYRRWANALRYSHPFLASELLMRIVKTYEDEASREDTEAGINRRLR